MRFGASKYLIRKFDLVDSKVWRQLPNVELLFGDRYYQGCDGKTAQTVQPLGFWIRVNWMGQRRCTERGGW